MFVWYQGCNRAWCGYTGGVVYSRTPSLAPEALAVIKQVGGFLSKAGLHRCERTDRH